jgi:hypothetical protein
MDSHQPLMRKPKASLLFELDAKINEFQAALKECCSAWI